MSVTVSHDGDIARVEIGNPPVNALGHSVRAGLLAAIREIERARPHAVLLTCRGRTFCAGADAKEFDAPARAPLLSDVLTKIERASMPWIALLHGTVLGGGLELALACRFRIARPDTRLGLPEVTLGLIPGAGGTVRLPRLIAPEAALDMIAGGKPINVMHALELGLVDAPVDPEDTASIAEVIAKILAQPDPGPIVERQPRHPASPDHWRASIAKQREKAGPQTAVVAAIDAVERSLSLNAKEALKAERAAFLRLKDGPQSAALRYLFFAERSVSRTSRAGDTRPRDLAVIGVVGGGTMGSGITTACLMAGFDARLLERDEAALSQGADRVRNILDGAVSRGKLDRDARARAETRLTLTTRTSDLAGCDLVIEAVFEDPILKTSIFQELDRHVGRETVLATNTSYLDVDSIAEATRHPERVIGLHFFSPPHVIRLLEVIQPRRASADSIATGFALAKRLGKIAVPAGVCDGFIGNRIMSAYRADADNMVLQGVRPDRIDGAMRAFGFPMGIFQMQDLAGLDIAWAMRKRRALLAPSDPPVSPIADRLCERGRFGRKTGRGWYDYTSHAQGTPDPEVAALINEEVERKGAVTLNLTEDEIMTRLIRAMQREGASVLNDGIAATAEAIDVVMANGYGFPRWRGGPMFMAARGDTI